MPDIQVSICCTSNRPHLWECFYETVAMNTINFEIIFIGPLEPIFNLPYNAKFINSNVKPSQCEFIAAINSTGELLLFTPDDAHNSSFLLDILYEQYKKENDYKCMVAPMKFGGIIDSVETTEDILNIVSSLSNQEGLKDSMFKNLQMQNGGLISKQAYLEIGGHDKRFVFGHQLTDVFIHLLKIGGKIVFCPDTYMLERKDLCPNWQNAHGINYSPAGYELLMYEWVENEIVKDKRTDAVQSFEINDTLLTKSQGPKGEWD